jgi:hypothetical protein
MACVATSSGRCILTIGSSERGSRLRLAKEGLDDLDKLPSFDAGEDPRRSTSSLAGIPGRSAGVDAGVQTYILAL